MAVVVDITLNLPYYGQANKISHQYTISIITSLFILNVLDLHLRDFSEHFPISYFGNFSDQKLMDAGTPFAKAFSFNHFH